MSFTTSLGWQVARGIQSAYQQGPSAAQFHLDGLARLVRDPQTAAGVSALREALTGGDPEAITSAQEALARSLDSDLEGSSIYFTVFLSSGDPVFVPFSPLWSPVRRPSTRQPISGSGSVGYELSVSQRPKQTEILENILKFIREELGVAVQIDPETGIATPPFIAISRERVKEFLVSLLRNPTVIADAQKEGGLYHEVIEKAAQAPLFIHIPSKDPIERLNFTSWMRVLSIRAHDYEDPTFADLYLLHELRHMTTMPYGHFPSFPDWANAMKFNEKHASMFSEAFVYFAIPELRAQFSIRPIWADRFLENRERLDPGRTNQEFYQADPKGFFDVLLKRFRDIDHRPVETLDELERRTALYTLTIDAWNEIWGKSGQDVERHMHTYLEYASKTSDDPDFAIPYHQRWLEGHSKHGIVYYDEMKAFQEAYEKLTKPARVVVPEPMEARLARLAATLEESWRREQVTPTALLLPTIELLRQAGITPTVYSVPFPESREITEEVWKRVGAYHALYGKPYLRGQDQVHKAMLAEYLRWASPVVVGLESYPFPYASNGSSEAIKDALSYFVKTRHPELTLHLFDGEYEGVNAYANALGIPIRYHDRDDLEAAIAKAKKGDFFYISHPSALDGNLWPDYDHFMQRTREAGLQVMVDLAYVGCVDRDYTIDVSHPHIQAVFFSLSKSFGVYYQRIGGAFFREANPLLTGNIWFKHVLSQTVGTELLRNYSVRDLPRRYAPRQKQAIAWINERLGTQLQPSDIILLGYQPHRGGQGSVQDERLKALFRGGLEEGFLRACLTAWMDT